MEIDPATGRVISFYNGQATVTVRDSAGQQASYSVSVSNVLHIDGYNGNNIYRVCTANAENYGGGIPTLDEWRRFRSVYASGVGLTPGGDSPAWTSTSAGGNLNYTIAPNNGAESCQPDQTFIGGGRGAAIGWAIVVRNA